jgi:pyruvate, water dikinase
MTWVRELDQVSADDVALVGGKNAALGEMLRELGGAGVPVPGGFAVTADGYRHLLAASGVAERIQAALRDVDLDAPEELAVQARAARGYLLAARMPDDLREEIVAAYRELSRRAGVDEAFVAVRSSATAEDLPTASFAGQQESFLMVHGERELLWAVQRAMASLFTARAISYRHDLGFGLADVALSVGVQRMVRSDLAASGVAFTLDPESGHRDVTLITSSWGLGENVVQGRVEPDEMYVHKPSLRRGHAALFLTHVGSKELKLVFDEAKHQLANVPTTPEERAALSLEEDEVLQLARWAAAIEDHFSRRRGAPSPMDIEWAKDGQTGELFVLQARPETVHSQRSGPRLRTYRLRGEAPVLVEGAAVGSSIAVGRARPLADPRLMAGLVPGEILVASHTDPDWEPVLKRAAGIVTERGGRTSHAAIVARELGIPAVVGAERAMSIIRSGATVTLSAAEGQTGRVYDGELAFDVEEIDLSTLERPRTPVLLNVGRPEQALQLAALPTAGVGLARMEFVLSDWIGIHPMALLHPERIDEDARREIARRLGPGAGPQRFVERLAQGVGTIAAAFWPRSVLVRFSDFKTNEYARLVGGAPFEPQEENPMLGWRGASRYYHPEYREAFLLEVAAVRRVRERMGLDNLQVMIPFCRTPEEGRRVLEVMAAGGLQRGAHGLEVWVMAELPSNIALASGFAELFDGFSIGSNDLTQLILGVDRDSTRAAPLFDERNEAVLAACADLIRRAHEKGRRVGICGQAPSDHPEVAAFLVRAGIDSISITPDALVSTLATLVAAERETGAPELARGVAAASEARR